MSSETSTEPRVTSPLATGDLRVSGSNTGTGADSRGEPLQPWQLFTLAGLIGATIVVFFARQQSPAGVVLLSLIVFAASGVGIAVLRTFLPLTVRGVSDLPQVLGGRTRAALERDKSIVLRALKELEFDRAMGKVSDKDFAEMSGRLRTRAARILRQLDAGVGYRLEIEKEIEKRIGPAPAELPVPPMAVAAGMTPPEVSTEMTSPPASEAGICAGCGTRNDPDARFCKECGQKLEAGA